MIKEKKYCAAPWKSLHLNFDGKIKTCCAATTELDTLIGSNELLEVKKSIQQGVLHPVYCENCIQNENAVGRSEREWHNNLNPEFDVRTADLNEHVPTLVDIRWTNLCNLACVYCSSFFSSKWGDILGNSVKNNINAKYQEVIDYVNQHKMQVKEVALVGGEPLLMKENAKLLDILSDDVLVTVISNMTIDFDKFPTPQKLLQRSRVGWSMSFENVGKRFEYVRWGSTWDQLNKNVTTVSKKMQNSDHHGGIHAVYNLYNCTRLCELKEYAESNNITILWQEVYGDHLNPVLHNDKVRKLAIKEIQKYRNTFEISKSDATFLNNKEKNLQQGTTDQSNEFLMFTENIENRWHLDQKGKFQELWPELAEVL